MNRTFVSIFLVLFINSIFGQGLDTKMWGVDGEVKTFLQVGNDIYTGGSFKNSGRVVGGAAILDTTFVANLNFPKFDGTIYFITDDGNGGYYAAGDFTRVDGNTLRNLAHVFEDGTLDENYHHAFDGDISCGTENDSLIFLGGNFTRINSTLHTRIAVINKRSGEILDVSILDSTVQNIIDITINDSLLFIGGTFYSTNGGRESFAAYNFKTNSYYDSIPHPNLGVYRITVKGDTLFLCGYFNTIDDSLRNGTAAYSLINDEVLDWNPGILAGISYYDDLVYAVRTSSGNYLEEYAPGDGNTPGRIIQIPQIARRIKATEDYIYLYYFYPYTPYALARVNRSSLTLDNSKKLEASQFITCFNKKDDKYLIGGMLSVVNMKPHEGLIKFNSTTAEIDTFDFRVHGSVEAVAQKDSILYIGGMFDSVLGQERFSLAAIDLTTMQLTNWAPQVSSINSIAIEDDKIYVTGSFNSIGDSLRTHAAILDKYGNVFPWNHYFNFYNSKVIIGDSAFYIIGRFDTVDNKAQYNFAAFEKTTGSLLPFKVTGLNWYDNGSIHHAVEDENYIYIVGLFDIYDGFRQRNFAAVDKHTGRLKTDFKPVVAGEGLDIIQLRDDVFYVSGPYQVGIFRKNGYRLESFLPIPGGYVAAILASENHVYSGGSISHSDGYPVSNIIRYTKPDLTSIANDESLIPQSSLLYQNYPNPFNSTTNIKFYIKEDSKVTLKIYDILGRRVKTIADDFLKNGEYTYKWEGKDNNNGVVASGVYFIMLKSLGVNITKKMVLLK